MKHLFLQVGGGSVGINAGAVKCCAAFCSKYTLFLYQFHSSAPILEHLRDSLPGLNRQHKIIRIEELPRVNSPDVFGGFFHHYLKKQGT